MIRKLRMKIVRLGYLPNNSPKLQLRFYDKKDYIRIIYDCRKSEWIYGEAL